MNNLGNLVNRVIKLIDKPKPRGYGGTVPDCSRPRDLDGCLGKWKETVNSFLGLYLRHLDAVELRAALITVFSISTAGNELAQKASRRFKSDKEGCGPFFLACLNFIHLLASLLQLLLPDNADSIARQLCVGQVSLPFQTHSTVNLSDLAISSVRLNISLRRRTSSELRVRRRSWAVADQKE